MLYELFIKGSSTCEKLRICLISKSNLWINSWMNSETCTLFDTAFRSSIISKNNKGCHYHSTFWVAVGLRSWWHLLRRWLSFDKISLRSVSAVLIWVLSVSISGVPSQCTFILPSGYSPPTKYTQSVAHVSSGCSRNSMASYHPYWWNHYHYLWHLSSRRLLESLRHYGLLSVKAHLQKADWIMEIALKQHRLFSKYDNSVSYLRIFSVDLCHQRFDNLLFTF